MDLCDWIEETPFNPLKPPLEFNKKEISKIVLEEARYTSENIIIKRNIDGESPYYIAKINKNANFYMGEICKKELKRNGIGINYYSNFDLYIGYFKDDLRNGHGVYFFKPEILLIKELKEKFFLEIGIIILLVIMMFWIEEPLNSNNFNKKKI